MPKVSKTACVQLQSDMCALTQKGYDNIVKELGDLKNQRPQVLDDIRRAAADKDFRENAPLHAAREQLSYMDGRIQELEATLKNATIIAPNKQHGLQICLGKTVTLVDLASGKMHCYTIVGPKEANPTGGKISHISPIGKALIGHSQGETVDVVVPSGKVCYRIDAVDG
ncbi:MAG: transcription elongation factor GreA [Dehalococcoidia bacterium]|nr:transcription elongation factor GreA [Dehalococcoidia bacterium]